MPETSLNQVYNQLGSLTANIDALNKTIIANEKRNAELVRKADESRAKVHDRLEDLARQNNQLDQDLTAIDNRLKKVEPIAEDISKWRERGIGILLFVGAISATIGTAITAFWNKIVGVFS